MKRLSLLLLIVGLFTFAACESDELATSNNVVLEKKLLLNPARLEGVRYGTYTFKARISNMPISDVSFWWNFGSGFTELYWSVQKTFNHNGTYYVWVKAYDIFTDSLLGYDSIRVDIRPAEQYVNLIPDLVDTVLLMNSDGSMKDVLYFQALASIPRYVTKAVWNFGDGTLEEVSVQDNLVYHRFASTGKFTVRVAVYDTSGLYIGTDSSLVTIGMPPLSFSDIQKAKQVSAFLAVDPLHPLTKDSLFANPLSIRLTLIDTGTMSLDFGPSSFTLSAKNFTQLKANYDTIAGEFTADLKKLRTVTVGVDDTSYATSGLRYHFTLTDLDLLAVTPSRIVYRSTSSVLSDFMQDVSFRASLVRNSPRGTFSSFDPQATSPTEGKTVPFGLVIFDR